MPLIKGEELDQETVAFSELSDKEAKEFLSIKKATEDKLVQELKLHVGKATFATKKMELAAYKSNNVKFFANKRRSKFFKIRGAV